MEVLEDVYGEELTFEGESSVPNNEDRNAETTAPPPAVPLSEPGPSGLNQSNRASRVTRPHRQRVGTQLENARSDFATLAERQVSCMEMLARSMEKMAVNDRQRNENDRERNEILRTLVESQKERDQVMIKLTGLLEDCVEHLKK